MMAVPLIYPSSSFLTPAHPCFRSPVISVRFDSFERDYSRLKANKYNLNDLVVGRPRYDGPVIDAKLCPNASEVRAVEYVVSEVGVDNLAVLSDRRVSTFSEYLQPLTSSLNVRPDGLLLSSSTNGPQLPMLCLEVHSGQYSNTVAKSVANLIDQLRLLSCFYPHLSKVSGFVFPKLSKRDDDDKITDNLSCVTQVDVEWVDLNFEVNFKVLDKSAVRATVKSVIGNQLTQLQTPGHFERYFVRLLPRDIAVIRNFIEASKVEDDTVEHLCQVDSKFSILVKSQKKYYKVLPRTSEDMQMRNFVTVVSAIQRVERPESIVMPTDQLVYDHRLMFFVFDAQDEHPLNHDEAKECIGDLVDQVVTALKQLHGIRWAHLDVRLPNICFTRNGNVRLIDLDRVNHKKADLTEYGKSFFYEIPENGSVIDVDWRQLGLLIYYVQTGVEIQKQPQVAKTNLRKLDPFLKELIVNFKLDERLLESWRTNLPQGSTVEHVLQERRHSM